MSTVDLPQEAPAGTSLSNRQLAGRTEVLAAAAAAFLARGYAATTIDDIADRLGATKGRVYHYFRTKGEIFIGIHRHALDIAISTVEPLAEGPASARQKIYAMAVAHATLMMTETSFMQVAAQPGKLQLASEGRTRKHDIDEIFELRRHYESIFEKVIGEGVANGEFVAKDVRLQALAVLGALNWMSMWYGQRTAEGNEDIKEQIAQTIAAFVTAGLAVEGHAAAIGS